MLLNKGMLGVIKGCVLVGNGLKFPRLKLLNTKVDALFSHVIVILMFTFIFFDDHHFLHCGLKFVHLK